MCERGESLGAAALTPKHVLLQSSELVARTGISEGFSLAPVVFE